MGSHKMLIWCEKKHLCSNTTVGTDIGIERSSRAARWNTRDKTYTDITVPELPTNTTKLDYLCTSSFYTFENILYSWASFWTTLSWRTSRRREIQRLYAFRCKQIDVVAIRSADLGRRRGLGQVRSVGQTCQGSFSAVLKPNFANKNSFESSRRDLPNALFCTALQSQFFVKVLPKNLQNFLNLAKSLNIFAIFGKF